MAQKKEGFCSGVGYSGSECVHVVGCCEHDNEHLGFIKCGKFLE